MAAIAKYLTPTDGSEEETFHGKLRVTPEEKISVIDTIRSIAYTNPDGTPYPDAARQASHCLQRILAEHKEVCQFLTHWKFPGPGQRETPVTDRQGLSRIMMLLPGKLAAKFRDKVSILLERYLNADRTLAEDILKRADAKDGTDTALSTLQQNNRIKSCLSTRNLNDAIKEYLDKHKGSGLMYPKVHDTNNLAVTGKTSSELRGIYKFGGSARDLLTEEQSAGMNYIQVIEAKKIRDSGESPLLVSKRVRERMEPVFKADGLHDARADKDCIQENVKVMRLNQRLTRESRTAIAVN
eukprot:jgi/Mesvir1/7211/Mv25796-RA.1